MEIVNNNKNIRVDISEIDIGECFILDGKLYLRIHEGFFHDKLKNETLFCNFTVDLTNNKLNSFRNGVSVNRVNAKLIVE